MKQAPSYRHVAVIDVGKTNAKLALVDMADLKEVDVVTRPNIVMNTAPYPHFDLEGHWAFFIKHLTRLHASHGVDAISVTTHGAAAVLLDDSGALAAPMLDYEHCGPDLFAAAYDALRPGFDHTGSPRLPGGLNIGAQLHWLFAQDPSLHARVAHIVTYPQYWGYKLTGRVACDVTSLGCHSDLWNPNTGAPSKLVETLGIAQKLAPARRPSDVLGTVSQAVADTCGLPATTPVACGIHDSNASLVPYLSQGKRVQSVVSTGTWVICMSLSGQIPRLDPTLDTLVNVNASGQAVPSSRFMGGREYEILLRAARADITDADRTAVIDGQMMLLPAVVQECGPFPNATASWTHEPQTDGQRAYAVSLYLALMTQYCLDLIAAADPIVIEGPFARNVDYLACLSQLRGAPINVSAAATGTAIGAAMLLTGATDLHLTTAEPAPDSATQMALESYCATWRTKVQDLR